MRDVLVRRWPGASDAPARFRRGQKAADGGHVYEAYNLRGQADYAWTRDAHALTVLAGTEILSSTTETTPSITRYGYNKYTNAVDATIDYETQAFTNIFGQAVTNPFTTLGTLSSYEDRFFSVYANAAYTYDDRYSVTASFRTDASNYQSESQRDKFSPFWSVGASWLLSNERFLEHADWLKDKIIRDTYKTLLSRAMKGCYVYCTDKALAQHIKDRLSSNQHLFYDFSKAVDAGMMTAEKVIIR